MKILNITTSNLEYTGVAMVLLSYYEYINDSDIILDYVVPNKVEENLKDRITKKGNKIFELSYKNRKMKQANPIKYCIELFKIIKKEKYDIVHVHGSSSMMFLELLVAKFAGVKIRIAHCHNTKSDFEKLHYLCKPFFKKSYTHAFACGDEAGKWLFGEKNKFIIIPNGRNVNLYKYDENTRQMVRVKNGISDEEILIGHVGFMDYQKNHYYLISVFNELLKLSSKYKMVLIGTGSLEEEIKDRIESMNLKDKIIMLGQLPLEETAKWFQAMDVFVFPSRFEGFPNVLVECQIAGLKCLISDKITNEVRITNLVEFESIDKDPKIWAEKIGEMNFKERKEMQNIILEEINNKGFNIIQNAEYLENLYKEIYLKYKSK